MLPKPRPIQIAKPDTITLKIAEKIRRQRIASSVSQQELADAIGVTFQQIQKYEYGKNRVASNNLLRIADALEVPVGYFFEGLSSTDKKIHYIEPEASPEDLRILRYIHKIQNKKNRKHIEELAIIYAETDLKNLKIS